MVGNIIVSYQNKQYEYQKNISLFEIAKDFQSNYKYDIIVGKIDNDILPLSYKLTDDCNIDFYDLSSFIGNRVYEKTAILIFVKAAKDVLNKNVKVEHSIDRGVYCTIDGLTEEEVKLIENKMREIIQLKLPIEKLVTNRIQMMQYYRNMRMHDKEELLKYISNTYITIYKLGNIYDYMFGEMAIDTSYVKEFKLEYIKGNGCALMLPLVCNNSELVCYTHHEKLFNSIIEYLNWSHRIGINTVADFNKMLSEGKWNELIFICEATYNKALLDIAHTIAGNKGIKLVLMSGPSCSGKTTTSRKLKAFLEAEGLKPSVLSLDDYFKEREETPLDENGNKDYESINAVDIDLFNNQLRDLLSYQEVLLPTYNFITGKKEYKNKLKIPKNGIIIIEGLHSLNDNLTSSISKERKYKIYMSPLTCLNLDNHNRLSTS
ncbi:MAG TPA: nucleoside kinase, partial [Bacilli bacterium]|nr:nucleoside kinase [Bacilli bacterium]